ncbi:MAG: DUF1294 domain-containing protein [Phycisphaerales bacterium]
MTLMNGSTPSVAGWVLIWMAFASIVTLLAHARDKSAARKGRRRTPERTLHLLEIVGGWPGAIIAMFLFHHKIRKPSYFLVTGLIVAGWVAVAIWWFRIFQM